MATTDSKPQDDASAEPIIIQEKISKKNGEVMIRKYARGKVLGRGGFATCYEITDLEQNKQYAAKIVSKSSLTKKRALEKLLAEIKIHKSLHHENIVQYERVFEDKENVYIILEICPNQTLKELLKKRKRISELECVLYMTQIINALKHLHEKRIIHRDLKLGNLLLGKSFDIKVADFGLAAKIEHDGEKRRTICGTPNYIAPEVLDKKQGHSYEVDVWSLGVICYTLLIGRPPFETNDTKATYRRIMKNDYSFPTAVTISDEAKDLIKKTLVLDPSARLTLDEILDHPFIKNNAENTKNKSTGVKKNPTLGTVQSPVAHGTLPTEPGFPLPVSSQRNTELDKNVYENDVQDHLFGSMKKNDRISTSTNQRPFTAGPNKLPTSTENLNGFASNGNFKPNDFKEFGPIIELDVHVTKWIDYSTKYGLGYLLSDGTSGVVFNDSTRVIMPSNMSKVEYLVKNSDQQRESLYVYGVDNYPKELEKKVLLLKHFKNYLLEGDKKEDDLWKDQETGDKENKLSPGKGNSLIYIKKWMKTKHATMFRLSNKIIQVDFEDKTQIILNSQQQVVHYRNKKGDCSQYPLLTALDIDYPEMVKRLKYTKEILVHIRQANNNLGTNQNNQNGVNKGQNEVPIEFGQQRNGTIEKLPQDNIYRGMYKMSD